MSRTKALRSLLEAPEILVMPGIYDGFSARLVATAGFHAAFVTGGGVSESRLAHPDVGIMGLEENVAAVRALANALAIPVIADGDTGYGNAINVYYTVRAFESAGAAGIMIEDQSMPKRCGFMDGKDLIPAEEMVQKLRAASDARRDPAFVIEARTDAATTHGLDEALRRLRLYAEAGADLLFAEGVLDPREIERAVRSAPKPLCVNMGFGIRRRSSAPLLSPKQLESLGVAAAIFPRMLTAAAIAGMSRALETFAHVLGSGEPIERPDLLASFDDINELMRLDEIRRMERRYETQS